MRWLIRCRREMRGAALVGGGQRLRRPIACSLMTRRQPITEAPVCASSGVMEPKPRSPWLQCGELPRESDRPNAFLTISSAASFLPKIGLSIGARKCQAAYQESGQLRHASADFCSLKVADLSVSL